MTETQFLALAYRDPFIPFSIRTSEGREYQVNSPERFWVPPGFNTVYVALEDGSMAFIDLSSVITVVTGVVTEVAPSEQQQQQQQHYGYPRRPRSRQHQCRLTQAIADKIREEYAAGATQKSIAARHGTTPGNVSAILRGLTWRYPEPNSSTNGTGLQS